MRRTETLWEVFVIRFEDALAQYRKRRLSGEEAGELLGMSGRQVRRLAVRYESDVLRNADIYTRYRQRAGPAAAFGGGPARSSGSRAQPGPG